MKEMPEFKTEEEENEYVNNLKELILEKLKGSDIFENHMTPYALTEIVIDKFKDNAYGRCAIIETIDCYEG